MSKAELAHQWPEFFDSPVPRTARREFLRMALAWQLQAKQQSAGTPRLGRRLRQIAESVAEGRTPRVLSAGPRVKLGIKLVRTWRDKDYTVTVTEKGFVLDGVSYQSLSQIARKITGTRWNGPSFFGLRAGKAKKPAEGSRGD